jgi:hypothetical protein
MMMGYTNEEDGKRIWDKGGKEIKEQKGQGNRPRYPLVRRLYGPKSQSGHCGEEKNLLPLPGT